jgi:spore germination protein KB
VRKLKLERIPQNQVVLFFTLYFYSTAVGFSFGPLTKLAHYDTWIVFMVSGLGGVMFAYFTIKLASRRPSEYFVHYGKEILPAWVHIPLMIILFFFFLHLGAYILREYEDFMVQKYLPTTPSAAVGIILGLVIAITVRIGIETLFRTAQGLFFLIVTMALTTNIFIGKDFVWDRGIAFLTNHGLQGMLKGSYSITPWFGEIILLIFFFPLISNHTKTLKSILWATVFSVFMLIINAVSLLLLFGPNLTSHLTYPVLEMVRLIRIADFIENLDPIIIAIWSTAVFLKVSILLYVSTIILSQLFRLKDYRPLSFSLMMVMFVMSLKMSESTAELNDFFETSWATFAFFVECIPILYLIVDTIKHLFQKGKSKKEEVF